MEASVRNRGSWGQLGVYNLCAQSDFESRPDGWEITEEAFKVHKILLAQAEAKGRPQVDILAEFCTDAKTIADHGRRLVCYHMDRGGVPDRGGQDGDKPKQAEWNVSPGGPPPT